MGFCAMVVYRDPIRGSPVIALGDLEHPRMVFSHFACVSTFILDSSALSNTDILAQLSVAFSSFRMGQLEVVVVVVVVGGGSPKRTISSVPLAMSWIASASRARPCRGAFQGTTSTSCCASNREDESGFQVSNDGGRANSVDYTNVDSLNSCIKAKYVDKTKS